MTAAAVVRRGASVGGRQVRAGEGGAGRRAVAQHDDVEQVDRVGRPGRHRVPAVPGGPGADLGGVERRQLGRGGAVDAEGAGRCGLLGEAGVRNSGDPHRRLRPVTYSVGEPVQVAFPGQGGDAVEPSRGVRRFRARLVQHDLVAVPGQLVVVDAVLGADVGSGRPGPVCPAQEPLGVDHQFLLQQDGLVDRGAQHGRCRIGVLGPLDARLERAQGGRPPDVAEDDPAARREQFPGAVQDPGEVALVGEVLHDRVEHHGVESAPGQSGEIVGGLVAQPDPVGQAGPGHLVAEPVDHGPGEVGGPVLLHPAGDVREQESGADAEFEDALG